MSATSNIASAEAPAVAIATLPQAQPMTAGAAARAAGAGGGGGKLSARRHGGTDLAPAAANPTPAEAMPLSWCGAETYGPRFGRGNSARQRRLRWTATVPAEQKRTIGDGNNKRTLVRADARLPGGQTVAEFLQDSARQRGPDEIRRGTTKQQQRDALRRDIAKWLGEIAQQRPQGTRAEHDDELRRRYGAIIAERARACEAKISLGSAFLRSVRRDPTDRRYGSGRAKIECSPEAWAFFKSIWLTPQQPTARVCWETTLVEARKHGWTWYAYTTLLGRIHQELPPFIADYYRLGPQGWSRKHGPRIERDLSGMRPMETWVGDHRLLDFICTDERGRPRRPWLTAFMDQRSRMIVGWVIGARPPDSDSIMAAFRQGVFEYGGPLHVIIDNGKDFRARAFSGGKRGRPKLDEERIQSVLGRLDVQVTFCEPFNPGSKAIESFFDTLAERFDKLFPSYCGRDPQHRPEQLYQQLRADQVDIPMLDDVWAKFRVFLDGYHRRAHSGDAMHGLSPLDVYRTCNPLPKRTAPADRLDLLLCKTVIVRVTRRGVRHDDVYYGQAEPELWRRHGQKVQLRLDPAWRDSVEVCELDGRHICDAYNQRLDGTKVEHIREARSRLKKARKLAQAVGTAFNDASKSVVDVVLDAQVEHAEQLRKAAGCENINPPPRGVQLLPAAARCAQAPYVRSAAPAAADDGPVKLDFGPEPEPEETVGDILPGLEYADE